MLDHFITWLRVRVRDQEGATAVEYGVMVALISVVIIAAVVALGTETCGAFDDTQASIAAQAATTGSGC